MIENNYLYIMAFDKLAVLGGSNIKHTGAVNAQCSLTLLENSVRPEKREKGSDPWSIRNRGRCTSLLFSKVLSYYQGAKWKETINIQEFLYIRGHKKAFLPYNAHMQTEALLLPSIILHCSRFKLCVAAQFLYLLFHSIWFISCGANILSKALKKGQRIWKRRDGQVQWLMTVQFRMQGNKVVKDSYLQHRCIWIH